MNDKKEEPTEGELMTVPTRDKENAMLEIVPFGTMDRIRLSAAIVRQMIAVPTRSKKLPDDNQCIKFIMLCQAKHLNPFEGDAFMIGYDTQDGPQFSQITAHQVFLKRAEASRGFNGMESGVIVKAKHAGLPSNPAYEEREGDLVYDDETLIGGWAKVYRKNLDKPIYRRLKLATFNTGRSRWEKDPAGMIVKCAEADALRTAFPTHLGGLYIEEERPTIDVEPTIKRASVPKLNDKENGGDELRQNQPESMNQSATTNSARSTEAISDAAPTVQPAGAAPKKKLTRKKKEQTPSEPQAQPNREAMLKLLSSANCTHDQFTQIALAQGWIEQGETWYSLSEENLAQFIDPENWAAAILPELEALKK